MSQERRSPLEATYQTLGAAFAPVRGCRLPARFGDVRAEYHAVRQTAGVIDRTDRAHLTTTGPDAVDYLQRMLSNEVKALQAGEGCYATLLTPQGHLVADLYLLRMDDHLLLECDWLRKEPLRQMLEKYIIADQVELEDLSQRLASLSVEGPQAGKLLSAAGAVRLPGRELNHTWIELAGTPVHVTRQSETGEEGYRLFFVTEFAQKVWDALVAQQKNVPWKPAGREALDILRTEAGVPWFGAELDESTLPPEAGLEATAISYQKGCYVGQEIIERIRSRGHVNRKLAGLRLEAETLPTVGTKLRAGKKEAGHLTTVVDSPALGGPIALGYVRREHLEPGTTLQLESGGTARVVKLPFYHATHPALERR